MIIVIGGSSFIGTYLVDELLKFNYDVVVTGNSAKNLEYFIDKKIQFIKLDISKANEFEKLPKDNVDAVICVASLLPANDKCLKNQAYVDVNISGTINVLEYCKQHGIKKLVNASSHSDVSGLWDCGRAITEQDQRCINYKGDHALYIISKIASMDIIEHYRQEYGIQGISFRLPAVYGYGPHTEIYVDGKPKVPGFTTFIRRATTGEPIEIWGDKNKGRDLVYVKDVAFAFRKAIESESAHGLYNIASGVRTTLDDEVKGIIKVFSPQDKQSKLIYRPDRQDMPFAYLYDIKKAKNDLGYTIKYPLMDMLYDIKDEMLKKRFPHLIAREIKQ
jgi:UDP-glucose 4-epimerase